MTDALAHLSAYPSGELDPTDAEAVESLIALYLDGKLEPEVAEQVTAVIEADAAVAAIVNEAREGKAWIEDVFAPESRRLMQQPASQGTIDLIHNLVAGGELSSEVSDAETTVIDLPPKTDKRGSGWQPWLMAASIVALLIAGSGAYYAMQNRLDEASSRQLALEQQIERLSAERDASTARATTLDADVANLQDRLANAETGRTAVESELEAANRTIAALQDEQGSLEQRVAALRDELTSTGSEVGRLEQQRATLAADIERLHAALTDAETEREQAAIALAANEQETAALRGELGELRTAFDSTDNARATALAQLDQAQATVAALRTGQAEAEERLAALDADLQQAGERAAALEQERSTLADEIDQLQTTLAETSREREDAARALAAADQARATTVRQLAEAESTIDTLEGSRADLEQRLAGLGLDVLRATSALDVRDRELAALERELTAAQTAASDARNQIAELAIERRDLDAELAALRASQRWLPQVAQYHAFYAKLPARRWAEETPRNQEELASLLADLGQALDLNRPLPLPEPITGLTFVGGRPLPVNGMPVVQLAYTDPDGRLFAFCFMRNPTGEIKEPKPQRIGDLTLDSWSDTRFQYVVIGYEPLAFVSNIANQLREGYRLDT